jgi:hypothetical protein
MYVYVAEIGCLIWIVELNWVKNLELRPHNIKFL